MDIKQIYTDLSKYSYDLECCDAHMIIDEADLSLSSLIHYDACPQSVNIQMHMAPNCFFHILNLTRAYYNTQSCCVPMLLNGDDP